MSEKNTQRSIQSMWPKLHSYVRPTVTIDLCSTMPTVDGEFPMNLSYFETFHKLKSKDQIDEEYGSMSLTSSIETWCDHRKWIFEDIRVEVLSLLTDLATTIHVGPQSEASSLILRRFNDEEIFSAIIYYFRLLANEFLKANSVTEQDFNPDGTRG
ncbi:hypothetical protein VE00_10599 [Pseudogymnoascus sp. WSF 3629]|nr:hypothetical protein VE00_10599 [Pseudogymnoascus sp. WSF 3629]